MKNNFMFTMIIWILMMLLTLSMFWMPSILMKMSIVEITTMLLIYYMNKTSSFFSSLPTFYYMTSVISSISFLFFIYMSHYINNIDCFNWMIVITQFMMFLKLGIYPFSMWLINYSEEMNWNQLLMMTTVGKFPLMIFMAELPLSNVIVMLLLFNSLVISTQSLFYCWSYKKIIMASSIVHSFTFILLVYINKLLFIYYMIIYSFILISLIIMFKKFLDLEINYNFKAKWLFKFIYFLLIISYMMLPPMMMFIVKWLFAFKLLVILDNLWMIMYLFFISNLIMLWNYFMFTKMIFIIKKINSNFLNNINYKFFFIFLITTSMILYCYYIGL